MAINKGRTHLCCNIVAQTKYAFRLCFLLLVTLLSSLLCYCYLLSLCLSLCIQCCVLHCKRALFKLYFMCAAMLSLIHCNSSSSRFLVPFVFFCALIAFFLNPNRNHSLLSSHLEVFFSSSLSSFGVYSVALNQPAFCIHRQFFVFIGFGRYRTNFQCKMPFERVLFSLFASIFFSVRC